MDIRGSKSLQGGMALIAVLWMVAVMSLIITGIVQAVRGEAKTVGLQRQIVVADGLADAAILLALQSLQAQKVEPGKDIKSVTISFQERSYQVWVQPLNGLIDLNNAQPNLLADMYRYVGEIAPDSANALAQATVDFRQTKSPKGQLQGFASVEDLMRVPSMTYGLYAKIKDTVTADLKEGGGRVNPFAAPQSVLQVLTSGDVSRAAVLASKRDADPVLMDTSFLKPDFIEVAASRSVALRVRVELPGGNAFQKVWKTYWGTDPRTGLPWRVFDTQQSIQPVAQIEN
jgi:general secretion pathway protein K